MAGGGQRDATRVQRQEGTEGGCVYLIEVSTNLREVEQCKSSVTLGCLSTKISKAAFGSDFCGQLSQFLIYLLISMFKRQLSILSIIDASL